MFVGRAEAVELQRHGLPPASLQLHSPQRLQVLKVIGAAHLGDRFITSHEAVHHSPAGVGIEAAVPEPEAAGIAVIGLSLIHI